MDYSDRSDGFRTFTGFDPQPDIHNLYHRLEYSFRPEGKHLISWGPQMEVYHTFDHEGNYLNSGYFPALKTEFVGQTFLNIYYAKEMELLRPRDFSVLTHNQKYVRHTTEVEFKTSLYRPIIFSTGLSLWHPDQLRLARQCGSISRGTKQRHHHPDGAAQQVAAHRQHLSAFPAAQPAGISRQPEQSHHPFQVELSVHQKTFVPLHRRVQRGSGESGFHVS